MIVPVMAISNLVLTQQIYSEETNGAHAHNRDRVPLRKYDGDYNKNGKRAAGFDWQKTNFARASSIFLHVFAFDARFQSETFYFQAFWRT